LQPPSQEDEDAWPFIFLLEMTGILQGTQPVGKVREALDGQEKGNIRYWVYIVWYESLANKLLNSVLRTLF